MESGIFHALINGNILLPPTTARDPTRTDSLVMDSLKDFAVKETCSVPVPAINGTVIFVNGTTNVCPSKYNCSAMGLNGTSIGIGPTPTYLSIVSCSLSCIGSLLIFLTFCCLKDVRKNGAQRIITLLALADFMQASGYLLGGWNYLSHYGLDPYDPQYHHKCEIVFQKVCKAQSFITSWASMSSFCWTCALALHFFLVLSQTGRKWTTKWWLFLVGNIIAWGFPLIIVTTFLIMDKLGYAPYAAANWCFVKSDAGNGLQYKEILIVLFNGKLWEVLTYVVVLVLYCVTRKRFQKQVTSWPIYILLYCITLYMHARIHADNEYSAGTK